jgi:hypothetical protein
MAEARIKRKIRELLKRELFPKPSDVVSVTDGDGGDDDIHLVVISDKLERRGLREKSDLIWDELQSKLKPEEWGQVSIAIALGPIEANGASIKDIKTGLFVRGGKPQD